MVMPRLQMEVHAFTVYSCYEALPCTCLLSVTSDIGRRQGPGRFSPAKPTTRTAQCLAARCVSCEMEILRANVAVCGTKPRGRQSPNSHVRIHHPFWYRCLEVFAFVVSRWLVSLAVPRGAGHSVIDGRDWASVEASKGLGNFDDVAHASFYAAQRCAHC